MAKAKRPVSINGIEFDALISEERTLQANIPEYVVEDGFVISDAVIFTPERITMTLYVTDTPVTWRNTHGGSGWVDTICQQLENLYYKGSPVTIITSDKTYQNMCIESITFTKSFEEGYARSIPVTFKQIRKTKAETTYIPSKYGKSGTSYTQTGSASTSSGSVSVDDLYDYDFSSDDTTADLEVDLDEFYAMLELINGTSSGSSSGSDVSGSSGSGSILHGIASALGWI